MQPLPSIGKFTPMNPFFLAPMEAVNCASFRLVCKRRGAGLIYTDMIDADIFAEQAKETSPEAAVKKLINPQPEEQPLCIQLGGAKIENLLFTIKHVQKHAAVIDYNIGCPLGYMLGKKGGVYLMKHPDQLYKVLKEMRKAIQLPFTIKIRSGWDEESVNAVEVAKEAEKIGIDAVAVHARTRKQRYQKKSDWKLVAKVKQAVKIPVILSGDVVNVYTAIKAFEHTKCDYIMLARAAQTNPSVFGQLLEYWKKGIVPRKPRYTYGKEQVKPKKDFEDFLKLYKSKESRYNLSEIRDHALWTAKECQNHDRITRQLMNADTEERIVSIVKGLRF